MQLVGTRMLAVPVSAGAAAFTVADPLYAPYGLEPSPGIARMFYGVLIGAMVAGTLFNFIPIDPVRALYGSEMLDP